MPIYEYQCQSCEHEFETIQKMSEAPLKRCPSCGKDRLKKKISAVAFRLKGGGWYETDFKSGDKKNVATSSDADTSSDGASAKAATKSESKGAPTSDSKSSDGASTAAEKTSKPKASGSSSAKKSTKRGTTAKTKSPTKSPRGKSKDR